MRPSSGTSNDSNRPADLRPRRPRTHDRRADPRVVRIITSVRMIEAVTEELEHPDPQRRLDHVSAATETTRPRTRRVLLGPARAPGPQPELSRPGPRPAPGHHHRGREHPDCLNKLAVYAGLGFPEVWGTTAGPSASPAYSRTARMPGSTDSPTFPFLPLAELVRFLGRPRGPTRRPGFAPSGRGLRPRSPCAPRACRRRRSASLTRRIELEPEGG